MRHGASPLPLHALCGSGLARETRAWFGVHVIDLYPLLRNYDVWGETVK